LPQESRDHHFGRLFGAEAIIRSGILFQPDFSLAEWTRLLVLIFDLAREKPWLREECGWIIYRCIDDLASRKASGEFVTAVLNHLCSSGLARTPEGVSIWIAVNDAFPGTNFPKGAWKYDDPLDARNRASLAKIMKESPGPEDDSGKEERMAKNSGVWNSRLHFAWDAILARIYDIGSERKSKDKGSESSRISFVDFWVEVVDSEYPIMPVTSRLEKTDQPPI
jgi:DNA polymerase phi